MSTNEKTIAFIKSHAHEGCKQYLTYDASNRMEIVYEAPTDFENGAPCLKTQYVYDGTSTRVIKMKESIATWSSSWDI
jgi:hypothetical protein